MMLSKNLILSTLLILLLVSLLGCGEGEEAPVETILLSPELSGLTPQEIAQTALQSTVFLQVQKPQNEITSASGFEERLVSRWGRQHILP